MLDDFDLAVAFGNNLYYTAADAARKHWALGDHSCGWGLQVVVHMESQAAMISCSVSRRVRQYIIQIHIGLLGDLAASSALGRLRVSWALLP